MSDLIYDEKAIKEFGNMFVSSIGTQDHVKYMFLQSRNKYNDSKGKNAQVARSIVTSPCINKFVNIIQNYRFDNYDPNTLVVYFAINPRSMVKAFTKTQTQVMDYLLKVTNGNKSDFKITNLLSHLKSNIHSSTSEKTYIELDIDTKDSTIVDKIRTKIQPFLEYITCTIETHGGYHVIFKIHKQPRGEMYKVFNSNEWNFNGINRIGKNIIKRFVDVRADPTAPVPGTLQAGFEVKFLYNFWIIP